MVNPVIISLSYNNQEEGFTLPVNPSEIEVRQGGNSQTYEVAGLGEISVIRSPSLQEYAFSGLFPAAGVREYVTERGQGDTPFASIADYLTSSFPPEWYILLLEKWMAAKRPIRFTWSGGGLTINEPVSIEKFDWKEVAGAPGDIEYSLALRKFVFHRAGKIKIDTPDNKPVKQPARPNEKIPPKTYKLVAGDTLIGVARKQLGDDSRWREIQKLNNITDAQLKTLQIGMVLKLPA